MPTFVERKLLHDVHPVVSLLLEYGADPDMEFAFQNRAKWDPRKEPPGAIRVPAQYNPDPRIRNRLLKTRTTAIVRLEPSSLQIGHCIEYPDYYYQDTDETLGLDLPRPLPGDEDGDQVSSQHHGHRNSAVYPTTTAALKQCASQSPPPIERDVSQHKVPSIQPRSQASEEAGDFWSKLSRDGFWSGKRVDVDGNDFSWSNVCIALQRSVSEAVKKCAIG